MKWKLTLVAGVLAALALCVAQAASYTFVVPPLLTVHFDPSDPSAWTYRFSLITLQLVAVIHVGTSALVVEPGAAFDGSCRMGAVDWVQDAPASSEASEDAPAEAEDVTEFATAVRSEA